MHAVKGSRKCSVDFGSIWTHDTFIYIQQTGKQGLSAIPTHWRCCSWQKCVHDNGCINESINNWFSYSGFCIVYLSWLNYCRSLAVWERKLTQANSPFQTEVFRTGTALVNNKSDCMYQAVPLVEFIKHLLTSLCGHRWGLFRLSGSS